MTRSFSFDLPDEAGTTRLAETLSLALMQGDLVFLNGTLGAGKSFFARALIRNCLNDAYAEVPSPTFTLVQLYEETRFAQLAHLDLYRLAEPEEVEELGLDDVLIDGAALVEWPEKGEGFLPAPQFNITLEQGEGEEARIITISAEDGDDKSPAARLQRSLDIRAFLNEAGCQENQRFYLTGDASARAYETVIQAEKPSLVLMNAPETADGPVLEKWGKPYSQVARLAEDLHAFIGVGDKLRDAGLAVPAFHASTLQSGLLLLEHLGGDAIIDEERQPIGERYQASIELLAHMHTMKWSALCETPNDAPHIIPPYDRQAMLIEVDLLAQWYAPFCLGRALNEAEENEFVALWNGLIDQMDTAQTTLVLRDYHSPNIIWRGEKKGHDRIGLIDFQDALMGPAAYDVASLAQDARVDVSETMERQLLAAYCAARHDNTPNFNETEFRCHYAIMAALRVTKILGIFIRLSKRDGKHGYLAHLPRMQHYLQRSLTHEALADYGVWVNTILVPPSNK